MMDFLICFCKLKKIFYLDLDIQNFDNQCFIVNRILNNYNLFLRSYELKDKFQYLTVKNANKNNIVREILSCIVEKFNGFRIVAIE